MKTVFIIGELFKVEKVTCCQVSRSRITHGIEEEKRADIDTSTTAGQKTKRLFS
jgi:hypothetical protein